MAVIDRSSIEVDGLTFTVKILTDEGHEAPWVENDCHGIVSEWRPSDTKRPGERVLCADHGSARFYDIAATLRIAKRDGWGMDLEAISQLALQLGRTPTKGDIAAKTVDNDFAYLRRWCTDDWYYVGVVVQLAGTTESESLWGLDSSDDKYLEEVARGCAAEIIERTELAVRA